MIAKYVTNLTVDIFPHYKSWYSTPMSQPIITTIICDLSYTLLFPVNEGYKPGRNGLNNLYRIVSGEPDFRFLDFFIFNDELLEKFSSLKDNYSLYVYTSEHIQNDPVCLERLKPIFKDILSAADLGLSKQDSKGYYVLADKLGLQPQEILFIDDMEANSEAASKAGMNIIVYRSNKQVLEALEEIKSNQ